MLFVSFVPHLSHLLLVSLLGPQHTLLLPLTGYSTQGSIHGMPVDNPGEPVFSHKNKLASHSSIVNTTRNKWGEKKQARPITPYVYKESLKCLCFSGG